MFVSIEAELLVHLSTNQPTKTQALSTRPKTPLLEQCAILTNNLNKHRAKNVCTCVLRYGQHQYDLSIIYMILVECANYNAT